MERCQVNVYSQHHRTMQPRTSKQSSHTEKDIFVVIVLVLLVISLVTTLTNVLIIYKLGLVPGYQYFTTLVAPSGDQVIVHKSAQISKLVLAENRIAQVDSILGNVELKTDGARLSMLDDRIELAAKRGLEIIDSDSGQQLYPFELDNIPITSIRSLSVPRGLHDVKSIRSPIGEDLRIESSRNVRFRGNQGVRVEGKRITMAANDVVFLSSINGSIVLDGHEGIFLDMASFNNNIAHEDFDGKTDDVKWQYKLCVCGKTGQLFRIAVKDVEGGCADARFPQSENPCA